MADVLLSLDISRPSDLGQKENLSYFVWLRGKVPDVVIEIVSNLEGGEDSTKLRDYARIRIPYYVIFDPDDVLGGGTLRVFELRGRKYQPVGPGWLEEVGLGLTLWQGSYEGVQGTLLRWCDRDGNVIPAGAEGKGQAQREIERLRAKLQELEAESPPVPAPGGCRRQKKRGDG